jgi:hypothetical protein
MTSSLGDIWGATDSGPVYETVTPTAWNGFADEEMQEIASVLFRRVRWLHDACLFSNEGIMSSLCIKNYNTYSKIFEGQDWTWMYSVDEVTMMELNSAADAVENSHNDDHEKIIKDGDGTLQEWVSTKWRS